MSTVRSRSERDRFTLLVFSVRTEPSLVPPALEGV